MLFKFHEWKLKIIQILTKVHQSPVPNFYSQAKKSVIRTNENFKNILPWKNSNSYLPSILDSPVFSLNRNLYLTYRFIGSCWFIAVPCKQHIHCSLSQEWFREAELVPVAILTPWSASLVPPGGLMHLRQCFFVPHQMLTRTSCRPGCNHLARPKRLDFSFL